MIPGSSYSDFLVEILRWLSTHQSEIVVVSCNTQGFSDDSMKPSTTTLDNVLTAARQQAGVPESKVAAGTLSQVSQTYQQLLDSNTRLIFLNQIDNETTKYDSYTDAYATLTPNPIIAALSAMNKEEQKKYNYTVLQIQGTATAIPAVIAASVISSSNTSSPLMSTKASFDHATLPWLLANVSNNLSNEYLTIVLNDFGDNATVSHCISITKQRMS